MKHTVGKVAQVVVVTAAIALVGFGLRACAIDEANAVRETRVAEGHIVAIQNGRDSVITLDTGAVIDVPGRVQFIMGGYYKFWYEHKEGGWWTGKSDTYKGFEYLGDK